MERPLRECPQQLVPGAGRALSLTPLTDLPDNFSFPGTPQTGSWAEGQAVPLAPNSSSRVRTPRTTRSQRSPMKGKRFLRRLLPEQRASAHHRMSPMEANLHVSAQ